jgi:hypothetical protein
VWRRDLACRSARLVMARMFQKFPYNLRDYSAKRFATA